MSDCRYCNFIIESSCSMLINAILINCSYQCCKSRSPTDSVQSASRRTPPRNLDKQTTITVDDKTFTVHADDLVKICDLGRGAYGIVEKMHHRPSNTTMAVKV